MSSSWTCSSSFWTREEDKAFEYALAIYSDDSNRWEKIAAAVPGRTVEEIIEHFKVLVSDVSAIESGIVPLPHFADPFKKSTKTTARAAVGRKGKQSAKNHSEQSVNNQSKNSSWERASRSERGRRRGLPWSEEEHRLFLQGLDQYGRGDWKSISRHFVHSRTPVQVASHAQKYFKRMDIIDKDRKQSRVHDVTILDDGKIVTQQVPGAADSFPVDTGLHSLSSSVGTELHNCLIESQFSLSTPHGPSSEDTPVDANFDSLDSLMDWLHSFPSSPGPSTQQTSEAIAGVGLYTPPIASQHNTSTSQEPIAKQMIESDVFDFCDPLFADEHDVAPPLGSMTGQVIGTAEGACTLNFQESSSQVHPDVGVHAAPTASRPIPEPVPADAALPGFFPSPDSSMCGLYAPDYAAFLFNFADDMAIPACATPPPNQN